MKVPAPFLKWPGGKRRLADAILARLPERCDLYVEPFLGGGAVALLVLAEGRCERAVLGDVNADLVATWQVVRDRPYALAREVLALGDRTRERFAQVRAEFNAHAAPVGGAQVTLDALLATPNAPGPDDALRQAARMVWLSKACFNGLWRVCSRGRFNTAPGDSTGPVELDADHLLAVSTLLQRAELVAGDFGPLLQRAGTGAAAYCDPPYWPAARGSVGFTGYAAGGFDAGAQARLAVEARAAAQRGAVVVLSNSDVPETRALYAGLRVGRVTARRAINRDGKGRGPVGELLVTAGDVDVGAAVAAGAGT